VPNYFNLQKEDARSGPDFRSRREAKSVQRRRPCPSWKQNLVAVARQCERHGRWSLPIGFSKMLSFGEAALRIIVAGTNE